MDIKLVLSTILATVLITACGGGSDDPNPPSDPPTGPQTNPGQPTGQPTTRYNGTFASQCFAETGDPDSYQVMVTINDSQLRHSTTAHRGNNCSQPALIEEYVLSISFPGTTTNTSQGVADDLNMVLQSSNDNGIEADQEDLEELDIFNGTDTTYSIILLDGITLYTGWDGDEDAFDGVGISAETRHDEFTSIPLTRQ